MQTLYVIILCILVLFILYILSIKPRIFSRPDYSPFSGRLYAHRGLHNMHHPDDQPEKIPENSMYAIKEAVKHGYGIEFDVHLTKDDIPVVFHDDTLERICGVSGNLKDYTYDELQKFKLMGTEEKIPLFTDVLKEVNGQVPLVIEYKVEKNANKLCYICNEILKDYNGLYCIESFHPQAVHWYRRNRPDIIRGQLSEDFTRENMKFTFFLLSHLIGNFYAAPDFIAYNCLHYDELSRNICRKLYHCLSVAWTVKSQEQLEDMKAHYDSFIFEDFIPSADSMHNM